MALGILIAIAVTLLVLGGLMALTDVWVLESFGAGFAFIGWTLLVLGVLILITLGVRHLFFSDRRESRGRRLT